MIFVLYHRRSKPTGEILAQALGAQHGEHLPWGINPDAVIRWGSRAIGHNVRCTINHASKIALASDKLRSLQLLRDAGISVPDWSEDPEEMEFPFLGRKIQHARGTDVVLCLQKGDYMRKPRDYYVQYIPTVREFRVHVVAGEVIRVQGKFLDNPREAVPWIRNYKTGYRFRTPRKKLNRDRTQQAIDAVRALELDFGAVDLLLSDSRTPFVLEVNTAPACSPLTGRAYVDAFKKFLNIPDEQLDLDKLSLLSSESENLNDESIEEIFEVTEEES